MPKVIYTQNNFLACAMPKVIYMQNNFFISLPFSRNNWESYPSFNNKVICLIPRFRWTHNNGPFMFCVRGEVDAELFHHPIKTLGHHPCFFVPTPTLRIEGTKGLTNSPNYILPGTLLPIFYESLCDFVSMTNCLLLSSCRNLCHNAIICD